MSAETAQLLAAFEAWPVPEEQVFVKELFRRLPPLDSGALDDEDVARAGDEMAAVLDKEEHDAATRVSVDVRLRDGGEGPAGVDSQHPLCRHRPRGGYRGVSQHSAAGLAV